MKAAVHSRYGPPEVVHVTEADRPAVGSTDLLVKVHATTVNRTDCGFRAGKPFFARFFTGLNRPKATIMGNEFAGVIEEAGAEVTAFSIGDRVFGYNEGSFGAHAEYLAIPEDGALATMPTGSSFEEIAPAIEGAHYALSFINKAGIGKGQDVLVNGGTGAIGSAAVQILKHLGTNVTAVCATDHLDLVVGLGADRAIDYTAVDFTADEQSFDVVYDTVGKSTFGRCKRLLKPGGLYLSSELGPFAQNPALALVTPLLRDKKVLLFPIPTHDAEMVRYFKGLIEAGEFMPLIDRSYPLDEIVEAYRYVESGQKIGNVVITVP